MLYTKLISVTCTKIQLCAQNTVLTIKYNCVYKVQSCVHQIQFCAPNTVLCTKYSFVEKKQLSRE